MKSKIQGTNRKLLRYYFLIPIITASLWILASAEALSQCPMCKAAVESANGNGETPMADGLNTGILYMFILPYLMIMGIGILWYRGYRKKKRAEAND